MPTLHHQTPMAKLVYLGCESTILPEFTQVIVEKHRYPEFISEYEDRPALHFVEESDFRYIHEIAVSNYKGILLTRFTYYPPFGFYNGLLDISFLQDL